MQFGKEPALFVLFCSFPTIENMKTNSNNSSQLEGVNQVNTGATTCESCFQKLCEGTSESLQVLSTPWLGCCCQSSLWLLALL